MYSQTRVKQTLGLKDATCRPRGKLRSTNRHQGMEVSVAKEIELADKFENMGAQMVKEVASKTSDVAGDGTTTATVLAQAIVREGLKAVAAECRIRWILKRGVDKAVSAAVGQVFTDYQHHVKDTKAIAQVGTIIS